MAVKVKTLKAHPTVFFLLQDAILGAAEMKAERPHLRTLFRVQDLVCDITGGDPTPVWPESLAARLPDMARQSVKVVPDDAPPLEMQLASGDADVLQTALKAYIPRSVPRLAKYVEMALALLETAPETDLQPKAKEPVKETPHA